MSTLVLGTLAVTWAWEALRMLPWGLPSFLWPFVVLALAVAFCWPAWHVAVAVAGASGIVHALLRDKTEAVRSQAVRMTRGIGGRVPPLP